MSCNCYSIKNLSVILPATPIGFDCNLNAFPTIAPNDTIQVCSNFTPGVVPGESLQINLIGDCSLCSCCGSSPSETPTQTPSPTPTLTPTQTKTPTVTPTNSVTPSTTPIKCGYGVTAGSFHYYFDCCGNQIQGTTSGQTVILDYTLPSSFVNKTFVSATQTCHSPTPTRTPTQTPTVTPTKNPTPTPTKTPTTTPTITPTPSQSPVYVLKNDCDVFTSFPLGVECAVIKQPSSPTTADGIIRVYITGGTSPYNVTWENGQIGEILYNVLPGDWESVVVDYYGDYSAYTICSLSAMTVSPTPTKTPTQTPTPPVVYQPICMFIDYVNPLTPDPQPIQFVPGSVINGKQSWINSTSQIVWNISQSRWELLNYNGITGQIISSTTSEPPLSGWVLLGNPAQVNISVLNGSCPSYLPLNYEVEVNGATCGQCNGAIIIYAGGGVPPYQYSVNGGNTYSTSNIFNGLCANNFTVVVKDSVNNNYNSQVTVPSIGNSVTYIIGVDNISVQDITAEQRLVSWIVTTSTLIPVGTTISLNLNIATEERTYEPGSGTFSHTNVVSKNGTPILPINSTNSNITQNRPNCPTNIVSNTTYDTYTLSMTAGDIISGTCYSQMAMTNFQVEPLTGCSTVLQQNIVVNVTDGTISGCDCCSLITNPKSLGGVSEHTIPIS